MTLRLAALATCASLGLASPTSAHPLDDLIRFDDPYWCDTGQDFGLLLDSLIRWDEDGESYRPVLQDPVVPAAFQARIGKPKLTITGREFEVVVPVDGTWQGLPLHGLDILGRIESEQGFGLVFDATPAQVLQAANRAGFAIPASGSEYRDVVNGVMGMNVAVTVSKDGRGVLSCFPG